MPQSVTGHRGGKKKPSKASKKDKQECESDAHSKQKQKEQVRAVQEATERAAKSGPLAGIQVNAFEDVNRDKDLTFKKSNLMKKMSLKEMEHALRLLQINDSEDKDKGITPEKNDLMMGLSFEELEVLSEFVDAGIETSSETYGFDQNELEMLKQCGIALKKPNEKSVASEEYPESDKVHDYEEVNKERSSQLKSLTPEELQLLKECGFSVRIPNVGFQNCSKCKNKALEECHELAS